MSTTLAVSTALVFAALILKITDFFKYLRHLDWNGLLSLLLTSVVGVVAVFLLKTTAWADDIRVAGQTLGKLDVWSSIIFGVVAASVASTLYDFKKAVDRSDTSSTPRLTPTAEHARKERLEQYFAGGAEADRAPEAARA